jgi:hypothetical protein
VWLSKIVAGHYDSGVSSATQIGLGNTGRIVSSQTPECPLRYASGSGSEFLWIWVISATLFLSNLRGKDQINDAGGQDDRYNVSQEKSGSRLFRVPLHLLSFQRQDCGHISRHARTSVLGRRTADSGS